MKLTEIIKEEVQGLRDKINEWIGDKKKIDENLVTPDLLKKFNFKEQ